MPRLNSEPLEDIALGLAEFGCLIGMMAVLGGGFALVVSLLGGF